MIWYDMKVDAVNAIIDCLECGYDGYYCDLHNEVFNKHNEVFNKDYYVIGTAEAKNILGEDVFDAIGKIYTYERNTFGKVLTNFSNPIKIANMLFYIIGEEIMYNNGEFSKILDKHWDEYSDEETNIELVKALKNSEIS